MTLRAIEIVESCLNFSAGVAKNDSTSRMVCAARGANPLRGDANTRHPSHSHHRFALGYSEFLTLSILRVKNSLPLTVFTQLQRREASRLE